MSDSPLYADEILTHRSEAPNRMERLLKWAVVALSVILAAELVWFVGVVPSMPLKTIDIEGAEELSRVALLKVAGIDGKSSFFGIDAALIKRNLESVAEIETASVVKRFPDGLSVGITLRKPVALSLAEKDGKIVPIAFDKHGVIYRVGVPIEEAARMGPLVSGLRFENVQAGMRLPAFLSSFTQDLDRIRREAPALLDAISEIRVVKKAYDGYELILYPAHRTVRVRIGSQLNEEVLQYMMLLLDVLASKGIDTDELDFRTGTASYRMKEG
jgi:cell division protein FtsQ